MSVTPEWHLLQALGVVLDRFDAREDQAVYGDKVASHLLHWGESLGYCRRTSYTQAEWTRAGVDRWHQLREASS